MTTSLPAWLAQYGSTPEAIARFRSFVNNETIQRVHDAWKQFRREPVPFSYWRWHRITVSDQNEDGREELELYGQLRDYMDGGGVLIIIGQSYADRIYVLERLMPLHVIDNSRPGLEQRARVRCDELPPMIFAIDEAHAHFGPDVARVIIDMKAANRGFAIAYHNPESFRDHEIGTYLAAHSVQFLELVDSPTPV